MTHAPSSLFKAILPHQPVAMLMLIENSQTMSHIWSDLRDQYLDRLVDNLTLANSSAPITVSYSGYHDGLRDVKFNFNPDNKISVGRINSCIDFLDSVKFQGQPPVLHLIIVAATTPSDDDSGTGFSSSGYSPWIFLAQKMAEKHIHCHMVVSPQHGMGSLTTLFEETLRLQENVEEKLYPQVDPSRMMIRLSGKPNYQVYSDPAPSNPYPPQHVVPRRNSYPVDNFYSERVEEPVTPLNGDADPPPSLVSQLQQVHGLTKKKVYGAKPTRQPFFRDERVRDKYRKAPTPLTMPLPMADKKLPSPTAGGRAISQSRVDRMARVGQASPTELHSRRQHGWPRRGSRLSTPEPENAPWPPSPSAYHDISPGSSYVSSVSSDLSAPVTPVTTMEEMYGFPKAVPSNAPTSIHGAPPSLTGYQIGRMPEPSWPQQQPPQQFHQQPQPQQYISAYNPVEESYFPPPPPPPPSQFYSSNGELVRDHETQSPPQRPQNPSVPPSLPPSSYNTYVTDSPPSMGSQPSSMANTPDGSPHPSAHATFAPAPIDTSFAAYVNARAAAPKRRASEEDEERFTFSKDFVAATAALFEAEVLPAYPDYPGMSSGLSTSGMQANLPSSIPASQPGELYASRVKRNPFMPPSAPKPGTTTFTYIPSHAAFAYGPPADAMVGKASYMPYNAPSYPPNYGSSLTGWAG
ncbi:hypothetical protein BDZ97DRAFT_1917274 [Flammula alnicola]|nr:hypothetical protein BDZ97DRAFT_1917274 [Flammula alnicola]